MNIDAYLIYRYLKCNHLKYHKYVYEWCNNVTQNQINYFIKEKEHLGL